MNYVPQSIRSVLNTVRDTYSPVSHTSAFRTKGEISAEDFVAAGDYLVYKFPSWSWSEAATPAQRVNYLPEKKQFLVTRGVPCRRRLGGTNIGSLAGGNDVKDVLVEEEWLSAGEDLRPPPTKAVVDSQEMLRDVKSMDESGRLGDAVGEEDDIPDMEDEDDDEDAIIRDTRFGGGKEDEFRNYTLYVMYSTYYRTPRLYLSGYTSDSTPLEPTKMMEDIVGDYKDKTVTLESFPFVSSGLRMASIHPCKHAPVMKNLLDRADAALKLRVAKLKAGEADANEVVRGMEGLEISALPQAVVGNTSKTSAAGEGKDAGHAEEWEVLQQPEGEEEEVAIRVDQYLVVFLKFMASVTPGIEHDFTMGV